MPSSGLAPAVEALRSGGLVAYPTETLYGLGADARSEEALAALRAWKGREEGHPISVLVSEPAALAPLGLCASPLAERLAERFWPGPLTLVVSAEPGAFARGVARADGAVGVRCSPHPLARRLAAALLAAGVGPVTATSLNRTGEPPAADAAAARRICELHPGPLLLEDESPLSCAPPGDGPPAPSTVVDCTGAEPQLIREGAVSAEALSAVANPR